MGHWNQALTPLHGRDPLGRTSRDLFLHLDFSILPTTRCKRFVQVMWAISEFSDKPFFQHYQQKNTLAWGFPGRNPAVTTRNPRVVCDIWAVLWWQPCPMVGSMQSSNQGSVVTICGLQLKLHFLQTFPSQRHSFLPAGFLAGIALAKKSRRDPKCSPGEIQLWSAIWAAFASEKLQ